MRTKKPIGDIVLMTLVYVTMAIMLVVTLYPFLNSLAISLNNADDTTRGGVTFYPRVFTMRNYQTIFRNEKIYTAYIITIARTLIGTATGLFFTSILAFALAHKQLAGRKFYTIFCLIPMYFSGGIIPMYMLIRSLGLLNNFWVYIVPNLVNLWNMILMRSYFQSLPEALEESARIDGARYWGVYWRIIFPISTPIIATICLYIGVFHWNSWYDAAYYVIMRQDLKPMQTVLLSIINEAAFAERIAANAGGAAIDMGNIGRGKVVNVRSITMATMIVTILPIVMVYPFIQRYFIKGIMIGSLKG
ncbi:MAG: carbohydrate ABC transporter permease [Clostridia bacterium]|nr:carbohydrate ABC transporter permease [Clostridia bacterium]